MTVLANGVPYSNYFAHRNLLINGDFRVNQRNGQNVTAQSTLNNFHFIADRMLLWSNDAALGYLTSNKSSMPNANWCTQIIGASGNTAAVISQRVETQNCSFGVGDKLTFSCWVHCTSQMDVSIGLEHNNDVDSATTSGLTTITKKTITNIQAYTWVQISITGTMPALARDNGVVVYIAKEGGIPAGVTFYTTNWQLERGEIATPFEHRPYGYELSLCQRYFVNVASSSWYGITAESSAVAYRMLSFPTRMRVSPSLSMRGQAVIRSPGGGTTVNTTSAVINGVNVDHVMVMYNFPNTPAIVSGQAIIAQAGELLFDAEIY